MDRGPAYRVETERLVIRCYAIEDHAAVSEGVVANLPHLRPWMPWVEGEPISEDARIARLRRFRGSFDLEQDFAYGIFDRASGAYLGGTGLHPRIGKDALEVGYWIDRAHEGRGLITEAAGALTRVAFGVHRVRRVEIRCDPANARSAAVPRRLGYTHEATLRRNVRMSDGTDRDTMIWTLHDDELAASAAARVELVARDAIGRTLL